MLSRATARTHGESIRRPRACCCCLLIAAVATPENRRNTLTQETTGRRREGAGLTGERNGAHPPVHRKKRPVLVEGRIPERVPVGAQSKERGVELRAGRTGIIELGDTFFRDQHELCSTIATRRQSEAKERARRRRVHTACVWVGEQHVAPRP